MKAKKALTLTEILIVILIITLLTGLLLPALSSARARSKEAVCISQLRQLAMVTLSYMDEQGGPPRSEGLDFTSGNSAAKALLVCPSDPNNGFATSQLLCAEVPISVRSSYYTPFSRSGGRWAQLLEADSNAGIIACRTHGTPRKFSDSGSSGFCQHAAYMYSGKVVRARRDGSVKVVPYTLETTTTGQLMFSMWKLFTDAPEPKP